MNSSTAWLDERRAQARERFAALGVPHRRIEDWKYSDLKAAIDDVDAGGKIIWTIEKQPDGIEVFNLSKVRDGAPDWVERYFGTLPQNTMASASFAQAPQGVAVRVPRGADIAGHLSLRFSHAGSARVLIVLEEGASLTLSEMHSTNDFANIGVEIVIGTNAQLNHVRVAGNKSAVQVSEYAVSVARDGVYRAHLFNAGGKLSRAEFQISLAGANAGAHLSGVSVLGDGTHSDVTTHVTHAVGHTESTQLFKHVAGGKSRAIYQGRITVEQGADKSDSRQTAKALLMGERAEADLKPELEIFADDVKCAHGAAVGDLDANALFYLRARGIPETEARNMLVRAFLEEAVDEVRSGKLRDAVWALVEEFLPKAMTP